MDKTAWTLGLLSGSGILKQSCHEAANTTGNYATLFVSIENLLRGHRDSERESQKWRREISCLFEVYLTETGRGMVPRGEGGLLQLGALQQRI